MIFYAQTVRSAARTLEVQNAAATTASYAAERQAFKARPKFYQRCAMPIALTLSTQNFSDTAKMEWCGALIDWTNLGDHYSKIEASHSGAHVDLKVTMPNGDVFHAENLELDETVFPELKMPCHILRYEQSTEVLNACVRAMRVGATLEISAFARPAAEVAKAAAKALGWQMQGVALLGKGGNASYRFEAIQPPQGLFLLLADAAKCDCEVSFPVPDHVVYSRPENRAGIITLRKQIEAAHTPAEAALLRQRVLVNDDALYQGFDRSDLWLAHAQWTLHAGKLALELEGTENKPSKRLDDALAMLLKASEAHQRFNAAIVPVELNQTLIDIYLARKEPKRARAVLIQTEAALKRVHGVDADALAGLRAKRLKILTALGQTARAETLLKALLNGILLNDDEIKIAASTFLLQQHLSARAAGLTDVRSSAAAQLADSLFQSAAFLDIDMVLKTDLMAYRDLQSQRLAFASADQNSTAVAAISASIDHINRMLAHEKP
jgi:hypothetical protein